MQDFIDLEGATGTRYRFRVWRDGAPHLPVAGNYVYVREEAVGCKVLTLGECNDLSQARSDWTKAARRGATHVFTRLNVSRAVRTAEHEDLAASHPTARVNEAQAC
jgi:hypothetical protein